MEKLEIKPVTWANGQVQMYQGQIRFNDGRIICGDPAPTVKDALEKFDEECKKWTTRAKEARLAIAAYCSENDIIFPKKPAKKN
jgi:hypothetical protein